MIRLKGGVFAAALVLVLLASEVASGQPFTLTTGVGDGNVTVGVDGFGTFGLNPGPNSSDLGYNPIGPTGPIASVWASGIAIRVGLVGPRTFLTSGMISGSGGLPNPAVTGTTTTGASNFVSNGLSFNLVQTVAPLFVGPNRTGSLLTQTYTINNPTAAPISFELVRYMDTERNVYGGGYFFAADGKEVIYADETPINPLLVGTTAIGGIPQISNRWEIDDLGRSPTLPTRILAGNPLADVVFGDANGDGVIDAAPYNHVRGMRNVYTLAPGATDVYLAHTVWGTGVATAVIFPTPRTPASGPGVLFGYTRDSQLLTIDTNPTAGIGAGTLVGPPTPTPAVGSGPFGISFRGNKLYTWDGTGLLIRELAPATGATINTINIGSTAAAEGDIVFRNDGIGFLSQRGGALVRFDLSVPNSSPALPLNPNLALDGLAYNPGGVLYGLVEGGGQLYTVNETTGNLTLVGPTGIVAFPANALGGLAADASGNFFAALTNFPNANPSFLFRINPSTGAATLLGNIGFTNVCGLAFMQSLTGGGGNEGSFGGAPGPPGSEGSFGFGGRLSSLGKIHSSLHRAGQQSILQGPFLEIPGHGRFLTPLPPWPGASLMVYHVPPKAPAESQLAVEQQASATPADIAWGILAGLALTLLLPASVACLFSSPTVLQPRRQ